MNGLLVGLGGMTVLFSTVMIRAETIKIGVAANFARTMTKIGAAFEHTTGHRVLFTFSSTGTLFIQIKNGAPYDAFFAADRLRAELLIKAGLAIEKSKFVYALGKLALFSPRFPINDNPLPILQESNFKHLAIANPLTAPYGAAAVEVMQAMKVFQTLQPKLIRGQNIAQVFQYIISQNAPLGFVALSQLVEREIYPSQQKTYYLPPQSMYTPIQQMAVVLKQTQKAEVVHLFMALVKSPQGIKIIQHYGYGIPP